jgi:hypothetical protein
MPFALGGLPAADTEYLANLTRPADPGRCQNAPMDPSVLWRAAVTQVLTVAAVSLLLAVTLPNSFFDDWGWLTGPAAWLACAALTARALNLDVRDVLLGAVLAGIPSAIAVLAGVHWLGVAVAVAAFAAWCAWLARRPGRLRWT